MLREGIGQRLKEGEREGEEKNREKEVKFIFICYRNMGCSFVVSAF